MPINLPLQSSGFYSGFLFLLFQQLRMLNSALFLILLGNIQPLTIKNKFAVFPICHFSNQGHFLLFLVLLEFYHEQVLNFAIWIGDSSSNSNLKAQCPLPHLIRVFVFLHSESTASQEHQYIQSFPLYAYNKYKNIFETVTHIIQSVETY